MKVHAREPLSPGEIQFVEAGMASVCGVDEAGRGPLAGPVVAAAVLHKDCGALKLGCDSKSLRPSERVSRCLVLCEQLQFGIGLATHQEIDAMNILQASLLAMTRAVQDLNVEKLDLILVDGNFPLSGFPVSRPVIHGDARVAIIGAASIIAKVTRDRMMIEYDREFPEYGFARNMGYPTLEHRIVLKRIGPCAIHRKTFRGVREFLQTDI